MLNLIFLKCQCEKIIWIKFEEKKNENGSS